MVKSRKITLTLKIFIYPGQLPCEQLLTFQETGSKSQIQGTLKMLLDADDIDFYDITIETDTEVLQFNDQFKASAEKSGTMFNLSKVKSKIAPSEENRLAKTMIEMFLDIRFRDKVTDGRFGIISIKLNGNEQCVFRFNKVISVKSLTPTATLVTPSEPELTTQDETFEEISTADADNYSDQLNNEDSSRLVDITHAPSSPLPPISRAWNKDGIITIIITVVSAIVGVTIISILIGVFCRRTSSVEENPRNEIERIANQDPLIIHPENIQQLRNSFIYDED